MTFSVCGLDLSLTSTGIAVVREGTPVTVAIGSTGKATATLDDRIARLATTTDSIVGTVAHYKPDLVVIEAPAFSRLVGQQHDRSGLWWLVVQMLVARKYPVLEVPPNCRAKYATGKGTAGKTEVVIAVTRRYPEVTFHADDEADALVLAAMGRRLLGEPIEDDLPKPHLDALKTLTLPGGLHAQDR